ncbi:cyclohexanone monooxygenase [Boletus edulis BED1]|uniref:Cyclohexanone monooxygenase n=1 Tax=Boletus edulis BED1 TaxID=1328754 RepID=A0AAD4GDT1_BOLED|nr:cyclohexanone monooxygenase [Boletus edulis BED1]
MIKETYDVIIVGGGFGGIYHLIHLRNLGLKCKLIEAESDLGGTWYWNTYPGARVDSEIPIYEFTLPELWKGWTWTERFPGWQELQAYFAYVDDKLNLHKDCRFNSRVTHTHWDDQLHVWHLACDGKDGVYKATARHLIMCMGFASKSYTPKLKGLETFQGEWSHTARWPKEGIETSGKRVGVIGTGASGVQVIQEIGRHVEHLTVFQRTPNLAIPMSQYRVSEQVQDHFKPVYEDIYRKLPTTFGSLPFDWIPRPMMKDSEEEREATLQTLWNRGGFHFWLANYQDLLLDKASNDAVYAFWRKKVSERIKDPKKRELLAPPVAPHPFGCKRPCQELHFYEVFNQDNVDLVDISLNPILEITPKGVKTKDKEYELDVLILATAELDIGFDTYTGAFMDLDLRGLDGETIQDHWRERTTTYLGMTIDNFPNLYFVHGPQGPAPCNAPTCVEIQGSWVIQTIEYLRQHGITKFTPTSHAALTYKRHIDSLFNATLFPLTKSLHNCANVAEKENEAYNYFGGVSVYKQELMEEIERGYPGFQREALRMARL